MNFRTSVVASIVTALFLGGSAVAQERLAFGATNSQSAHYAYFAALSQIVNTTYPEKYQASVVETGATVDNLKRMSRSQLDLGLVTTSTLYQAYNGTKEFEGRPIESKLLWAYSLAPQDVITLRDQGYETLADLEGQRMGPGMRGSSTETTSEEVFELFGIKPDWVRGTNAELANAIKDGRAVGFVKSAVGTQFEPPRVCRRLQLLRDWSHDEENSAV
ncbi:TAXI family TRAP transporter solute-binding subunit [Aurantimonas aggregata]|uniref:TAXI family TRAP transporter solute-binding subunit n=1 Tax=Aurantimonas aggregata TaxID=2047720 RepID=A0A6L9MN42_9HYPH|nr:TAXI family TRAP transporter solute-binding subunit [Aurantimonas aggregata]NDV89374.1 TAXI family TRAP transporter solute-binding subunit [Aurantimonas aggregata]